MITQIANLFPRRIARTIAAQSLDWLISQRAHVLQMAEQCGIDRLVVAAEIDQFIAASEPQPPTDNPAVDVVVPFCDGDSCYLLECLDGLAAQEHVRVIAHVVADGCGWPVLSSLDSGLSPLRYSTPGGWGPYRIANSLVRHGHCRSEFLAIQDADDISLPDRLWRQIALLRSQNADMISSANENFIHSGHEHHEGLRRKLAWQKVVRPGKVYDSVQRGHCVNPTRTMRRSFFEDLNGFAHLRCSADFDFDNRSRYSDAKVLDDQTILGRRRLHAASLSHGLMPIGSDLRKVDLAVVIKNQSVMQQTPTRAMARQLGMMHIAQPLDVIQ